LVKAFTLNYVKVISQNLRGEQPKNWGMYNQAPDWVKSQENTKFLGCSAAPIVNIMIIKIGWAPTRTPAQHHLAQLEAELPYRFEQPRRVSHET
jgi:hypothetical protein